MAMQAFGWPVCVVSAEPTVLVPLPLLLSLPQLGFHKLCFMTRAPWAEGSL